MNHFPGPWVIEAGFPISVTDADGHYVCEGISPAGEGNARLIAAAPELLEALKAMQEMYPGKTFCEVECVSGECEYCVLDRLVLAVIAKAEGTAKV